MKQKNVQIITLRDLLLKDIISQTKNINAESVMVKFKYPD